MSQAEAAMRRAGALLALAAASALVPVLFPAVVGRSHAMLVLPLFATLLLGCAAVNLPPAHRALAELSRRAAGAAREIFCPRGRAADKLRWAGFTCVMFYAVYVAGDVRAAAKEVSVEKVNPFILFLVFLAGAWTINLSMFKGRGPRPPTLAPELDDGEAGGGEEEEEEEEELYGRGVGEESQPLASLAAVFGGNLGRIPVQAHEKGSIVAGGGGRRA